MIGGMSSLYRGFWATLVRDIPGSMAYYATYDILRSQFTRSGQDAGTLTTLFCGGNRLSIIEVRGLHITNAQEWLE